MTDNELISQLQEDTLDQKVRGDYLENKCDGLMKAIDLFEKTDELCSNGDSMPKIRALARSAQNVVEMLPHGPDRYALVVALEPFLLAVPPETAS